MKSILIVGATSAIAVACARQWAPGQARFFLVGRSPGKLEQVAKDLLARGAEAAVCHHLDIDDVTLHAAMLDACENALPQIDIALIAAGTLPDQADCELNAATARAQFNTNGLSPIALLTDLANRMERRQLGTIAIISSVAGDRGRRSNYLYGSAKAALSTFCEGLRARLMPSKVHVLLIKPGFVATPMTTGLNLPALLVASADSVAGRIVGAVDKRRDTIYAPSFWWLIMLAIKHVPGFIFKRLKI